MNTTIPAKSYIGDVQRVMFKDLPFGLTDEDMSDFSKIDALECDKEFKDTLLIGKMMAVENRGKEHENCGIGPKMNISSNKYSSGCGIKASLPKDRKRGGRKMGEMERSAVIPHSSSWARMYQSPPRYTRDDLRYSRIVYSDTDRVLHDLGIGMDINAHLGALAMIGPASGCRADFSTKISTGLVPMNEKIDEPIESDDESISSELEEVD